MGVARKKRADKCRPFESANSTQFADKSSDAEASVNGGHAAGRP